MKTYKKGISLIVLVITVIVLAILATTVIVSISNTNIISKANDAVTEYNLKTYEDQLTIAYASWLIENSGSSFTDVSDLEEHGFNSDDLPAGYGTVLQDGKPVIISLSKWDGTTRATSFASGTGTAEDPYLISSGSELAYLAYRLNNGEGQSGEHYKLTTNIDLDNKAWTPISNFSGYLDGDNYTIYNLNINVANGNAAFINTMDGTGVGEGLSNLTISGGSVTGADAACFANTSSSADFVNCHNVGVNVTASGNAAGIVNNYLFGGVWNCSNSGNITGSYAAGIVCTGNTFSNLSFSSCKNYGNIIATEFGAAGLVLTTAYADDYVSGSYNYGNVHGVTYAAGVLARMEDSDTEYNNDNYNYGTVTVEDGGTIYTWDEAST